MKHKFRRYFCLSAARNGSIFQLHSPFLLISLIECWWSLSVWHRVCACHCLALINVDICFYSIFWRYFFFAQQRQSKINISLFFNPMTQKAFRCCGKGQRECSPSRKWTRRRVTWTAWRGDDELAVLLTPKIWWRDESLDILPFRQPWPATFVSAFKK